MVSNISITFMIISAVFCFILPIGTFIYFKITEKITFKPVLIGILTFIIFSQVLEKILHVIVINNNLFPTQIGFAIYGALAAGIFEEVGRFIMYRAFLKKNRHWKDGVAFGIGHGGIEAILLGGIGYVNFILYAALINSGNINQLAAKLPADTISKLKEMLMAPSFNFLLGSAERLFAFILQIGFSLIVLYAVRYRKTVYLILAVLLHALVDFGAALYQVKVISNVYFIEIFLAIFASVTLVYVVKSREAFKKEVS